MPWEGSLSHVKGARRARVLLCPHAGRDLVNMAKKRPNIIPIIEDARHPQKYRMLVPMVDIIFAGARTCPVPMHLHAPQICWSVSLASELLRRNTSAPVCLRQLH